MKLSTLDKRRAELDRCQTKAIYWTGRVDRARKALRYAEKAIATQDLIRAPIAEDQLPEDQSPAGVAFPGVL